MDNISQTNSRPVNFSFTQGIGEYSSAQLDQMDIGDLMTLVMTRMLDAKEVQFKQKLEQADARTKKLEGFGSGPQFPCKAGGLQGCARGDLGHLRPGFGTWRETRRGGPRPALQDQGARCGHLGWRGSIHQA